MPFFVLGVVGGLLTAWVERKVIGAEGVDFELTFTRAGPAGGPRHLVLLEQASVAGQSHFYLPTVGHQSA